MSDKTSAALMGGIFARLAEEAEQWDADKVEMRRAACVVWKEMHAQRLDFSLRQMECDAALEVLGLAKKVNVGLFNGEIRYADKEGELL